MSDLNARSFSTIGIKLVAGEVAPRYEDTTELEIVEFVVTEQGTAAKLPIVDVVMRTPDGKRVIAVTTGRLLLGVAAAIRGANLRNHGTPEP